MNKGEGWNGGGLQRPTTMALVVAERGRVLFAGDPNQFLDFHGALGKQNSLAPESTECQRQLSTRADDAWGAPSLTPARSKQHTSIGADDRADERVSLRDRLPIRPSVAAAKRRPSATVAERGRCQAQ